MPRRPRQPEGNGKKQTDDHRQQRQHQRRQAGDRGRLRVQVRRPAHLRQLGEREVRLLVVDLARAEEALLAAVGAVVPAQVLAEDGARHRASGERRAASGEGPATPPQTGAGLVIARDLSGGP